MITSIALVAITIALLFVVALVNKLWAIVQLQSRLLELTRERVAIFESELVGEAQARGQLRLQILKDDVHEQA